MKVTSYNKALLQEKLNKKSSPIKFVIRLYIVKNHIMNSTTEPGNARSKLDVLANAVTKHEPDYNNNNTINKHICFN